MTPHQTINYTYPYTTLLGSLFALMMGCSQDVCYTAVLSYITELVAQRTAALNAALEAHYAR